VLVPGPQLSPEQMFPIPWGASSDKREEMIKNGKEDARFYSHSSLPPVLPL
jgi:hypothetical protein